MTIIDVAKRAGVSHTTVSNVINNRPGVSPETVEQIWSVIREMGYRPRPPEQRRGPRGRRASVEGRIRVGLIWCDGSTVTQSSLGSDSLAGVTEAAERHDMDLSVFRGETDLGNLSDSNVAGDAFRGFLVYGDVPKQMASFLGQYPCVMLFSSGQLLQADRVRPNHEQIGQEAFRYLRSKGAVKFFLINTPVGSPAVSIRVKAFLQEASEAGVTIQELSLNNRMDENEAMLVAEEIAKAKSQKVGVFFTLDWLAPTIYAALRGIGCQPGVWLRAVGCNNTPFALDGLRPRPATFDVNSQLLGSLAVERLLWRLRNPGIDCAGILTLVPPRLVER